MDGMDFPPPREPRARALIPFGVFLLFYLGLSLWAGDFYRVPMLLAFLVAGASAMLLDHRQPLRRKIELFTSGMGHPDIMAMGLIFILAGAFAATAQAVGAVDAAVHLARWVIPARLQLAGVFLVSCFISLAIGTSVGTVVALSPIALSLTEPLNLSGALTLGAVVGGAMFGDNLSMISDTTIAATRTQQVEMSAKFRSNLAIALPAAGLALIGYVLLNREGAAPPPTPFSRRDLLLILPYLGVLLAALLGGNVMAVLMLGIACAGGLGVALGIFDLWGCFDAMESGVMAMSDTLIVALLAGGLLKVIRHNGGIEYLLQKIERHIRGRRGAELGTGLLVAVVNLFTANNTVAIVIVGPIARELSGRYRIAPARTASILDSTSCVVQGILPYGAQLLAAVGLAHGTVSAPELLKYMFYPYLLGAMLLISIYLAAREGKFPANA